jgi:predicted nucleic-acid-binding Zn-ribbon protein
MATLNKIYEGVLIFDNSYTHCTCQKCKIEWHLTASGFLNNQTLCPECGSTSDQKYVKG